MNDSDQKLLRDFANRGSEEAFRELGLLLGGTATVFVAHFIHHVHAGLWNPGARDAEFNTDTIQNPGLVDVEISGVPGTRFTARTRVGGKVTEIQKGVMPYSLQVAGRPFELVVLLQDGPGRIRVQAVSSQQTLGSSEVSPSLGINVHAHAEGGMSVGIIQPDDEKPRLLLLPVDSNLGAAAEPR